MLWCNVSESAPLLTQIGGETYLMWEGLHEIVQNSSNEEYTENKHSEGINVELDKEVYETEESALQGEDDGKKKT
jgi:hypothetical protein